MGHTSKKINMPMDSERISIFDTDYPIDKSDWVQVFSACLGKVMAIQNACAKQVVQDQDWSADFEEGTLTFGNDIYPVQFIGSEATSSDSWMWGWNNINGFNDNLIKLANKAKKIGESWNLKPLKTSTFPLDDTFNGHNLSIVLCGITKDHYCYYKGSHAGGAVFMAFSNVPACVFAPIGSPEFASIVMDCMEHMDVEHKILVESFLMWNGTKYDWDGENLIAHFSKDLIISFEKAGEFWRIISLKL